MHICMNNSTNPRCRELTESSVRTAEQKKIEPLKPIRSTLGLSTRCWHTFFALKNFFASLRAHRPPPSMVTVVRFATQVVAPPKLPNHLPGRGQIDLENQSTRCVVFCRLRYALGAHSQQWSSNEKGSLPLSFSSVYAAQIVPEGAEPP